MHSKEQELLACIARMESRVDLLETELSYIHEMLIRCGFPEGITSLKDTMQELIEEGLIPEEQKRKAN